VVTPDFLLFGFRMVKKPPDKTHNYGHGKFETLTSTIIGIALLIVGTGILYMGGTKMATFFRGALLEKPGWIALYTALFSIITKELLYHYTIGVGRSINSQALIANAWHQRSDSLSSIGVTFGIGGAILLGEKWHVLDPVSAIIVSFLIIKIGSSITIT
jgi:cation diffusion facilitator family transporter